MSFWYRISCAFAALTFDLLYSLLFSMLYTSPEIVQNASRVLAMAWASVRPSVRHTAVCIKTMRARITKFLLCVVPKTLVYRDEILCP